MLTWSSLPALDGIESTLAGWQSTLFSLTSDALATCAIMKPECSPLAGGEERREPGRQRRVHELLDAPLADVRELGDRHRGEVERERERLAVEVAAADDVGAAVVASRKTLGLSVTLLTSRSSTPRTQASASRVAPWTCGMQRRE